MRKTLIRKWRNVSVVFFLVCALLSSCGMIDKLPNEEQCLQDFIDYNEEHQILAYEISYNDLSIDKRQTNKDDKEDIVHCTIYAENEYASYEFKCILNYTYYDQGGWILDQVTLTDEQYTIEEAFNADEYCENIKNNPMNYLRMENGNVELSNPEITENFCNTETGEGNLIIQADVNGTMGDNTTTYASSIRIFIYFIFDQYSGTWNIVNSSYQYTDSSYWNILEGKWICQNANMQMAFTNTHSSIFTGFGRVSSWMGAYEILVDNPALFDIIGDSTVLIYLENNPNKLRKAYWYNPATQELRSLSNFEAEVYVNTHLNTKCIELDEYDGSLSLVFKKEGT